MVINFLSDLHKLRKLNKFIASFKRNEIKHETDLCRTVSFAAVKNSFRLLINKNKPPLFWNEIIENEKYNKLN